MKKDKESHHYEYHSVPHAKIKMWRATGWETTQILKGTYGGRYAVMMRRELPASPAAKRFEAKRFEAKQRERER